MDWIIGIGVSLGAAVWVHTDAKKRGKGDGAIGWAIGTFLLLIIVLPIWLITRPKMPGETESVGKPVLCVHCGKYYDGNPTFCPNCGQKTKEAVS